MSNLVVITFDNPEEADQVREALRQAEHGDEISLDDSAVVVKDDAGEIEVENEVDRGVKVGVLGGGLLGLVIGLLVGGPIASIVIGVVGGALGGDLANLGIDQTFIQDVGEALAPGTSALFLIVREAEADATLDALKPYKGQLYYTSLPEETEEQLRQGLSERTQEGY